MKCVTEDQRAFFAASHPSRGAWIEIHHKGGVVAKRKSHLSRGAWIEMKRC